MDEGRGLVFIGGSDVNHIRNVLRMRPGEQIRVSNGRDKDYLCALEEIGEEQVTARILEAEESTELPGEIWLFQGLPKSDKMELIIQKAVELGAAKIVPVATKRAVVKLDRKKEESKGKRWNAISESAAKQSKRLIIPEVTKVMTMKEACALAASFDVGFIPYEKAEGMGETRRSLGAVRPGMRIGVFIGPEGGFEEEEVALAIQSGIRPLTLGRRILRTETAGLYVLSVLGFLLEETDGSMGRGR